MFCPFASHRFASHIFVGHTSISPSFSSLTQNLRLSQSHSNGTIAVQLNSQLIFGAEHSGLVSSFTKRDRKLFCATESEKNHSKLFPESRLSMVFCEGKIKFTFESLFKLIAIGINIISIHIIHSQHVKAKVLKMTWLVRLITC